VPGLFLSFEAVILEYVRILNYTEYCLIFFFFPSLFFLLVGLVFELRASHFESRCSVAEPHLQSILLW
jgi:hypothetical protein